MTSINVNYNGYVVPPGPTSSTSSPPGTGGATGADGGLFPPPTTEPTAQDIERANKKQGLEAQLATYQAQKQMLENQLKQYTDYQNKLREKKQELLERQEKLEEEIKELETDKKQTQLDAEKLKVDYDKNNTTLLDLIQKMNDKISDVTDQSARAVQEQHKKIEDAQNEAFKLVQEGKLDENQVMDYIANKSGNPGLIQAMMQSGVEVVESMSSQIKGLISQMSASINSMNQKQLKIQALSCDIMSREDEKKVVGSEITIVSGEIDAVQVHIEQTQSKITVVDGDISTVQTSLAALEDPTTDVSGISAGTPDTGENGDNDDDYVFVSPNFGAFTMKLNDMENPNAPRAGGDGGGGTDGSGNPFMNVTSTIDYSGFKTLLDTIMSQNNTNISNLKNTIAENMKLLEQKTPTAA